MKYITAAAIIAGILALSGPAAYACSCVVPDVRDSYARASDVFIGEVADIIEPRSSDEKAPPVDRLFTIKFKVERSFKGRLSSEISVLADQGRLGCFSYRPVFRGERYLVYGDPFGGRGDGLVMINACNRTGLFNEDLVRPAFEPELRDWYGRVYRTDDLRELEEIKGTGFRVQFGRPPVKSKGETGLKLGW